MCCLRSFLQFYFPAQRRVHLGCEISQHVSSGERPLETSESAGGPLRSRLLRGGGVNESTLCSASTTISLHAPMNTPHSKLPRALRQQFVWTAVNAFVFSVRNLNYTAADFLCNCVLKITPSFKAKAEGRSDSSKLMHTFRRKVLAFQLWHGYFWITIK